MRTVFVLFAIFAVVAADYDTLCPADLAPLIDEILMNSSFASSHIGLLFVYLNEGETLPLYGSNANSFFTPASNNKLLTTSTAFSMLGSDFTFSTTFSESCGETCTMCIHGEGDSTFTTATLMGVLNSTQPWNYDTIVLDNTYFNGPDFPIDWEWDDLMSNYGAQPSALMLNENYYTFNVAPGSYVGAAASIEAVAPTLQGALLVDNQCTTTTGSDSNLAVYYLPGSPAVIVQGTIGIAASPQFQFISVLVPELHFQMSVQAIVDSLGYNSTVVMGACTPEMKTVQAVTSPTLQVIMNSTLQNSDNTQAEVWLRTVGATHMLNDSVPAEENGLANVQRFLHSIGVSDNGFVQVDGSGVSHENMVTPATVVQILTHMADQPNYISMLPVAGVSGTLIGRMVNTPAQGIVHAKTGTLSGVTALSGYMLHDAFPPVVFSTFTNMGNMGAEEARELIDSIIVLLPRLRLCPDA